MNQSQRIAKAQTIGKDAALRGDDCSENPHVWDDTGRLAAEAFHEEGPAAAAEVIAAYHVAFRQHAPAEHAPTWQQEIEAIGLALPPSVMDEDGAAEQVEEAMKKLHP